MATARRTTAHHGAHSEVTRRGAPPARSKVGAPTPQTQPHLLLRLREIALRALARMYLPERGLFALRGVRAGKGLAIEGESRSSTAIALLGLSREAPETGAAVLSGATPRQVCERLGEDVLEDDDIGSVALACWASRALGAEARERIGDRLLALGPADQPVSTVALAWTLAALSLGDESKNMTFLRERVADRLRRAYRKESAIFVRALPVTPENRGHASCFEDLACPILALSLHARRTGDHRSLEIAIACARSACRRQGPDGQWWWRHDARTGRVVEAYPVYSVHQHGLAPMALLSLLDVSSADFTASVERGVRWLARCPEFERPGLIDDERGVIWRKVDRADPRTHARAAPATAGRGPQPPPCAVDHECRAYEPGWLLYAWPLERATQWTGAGRL